MSRSPTEQFALSVTRGIGSPTSIIIHSLLFVGSFGLAVFGIVDWDKMLLVLTTIVSLEAIYLAIFIQMTINYTAEDVEEIQEDIDEIQEDVDEIQEDIEEVQEDVDEIQEDIEEVQEDVEEMSEDVEEMTEEEQQDTKRKNEQKGALAAIQTDLRKLLEDVERLKNSGK